MNDSTSSEQPPALSPLLTPLPYTSTVKELWLQERTPGFSFNEYRLNEIPESLKAFVDQLLKEDGRYDKDRFIWTSDNSFVRVGSNRHDDLPGVYRNNRFALRLTSGSHDLYLYIHSTTLEDAISCLDFLGDPR
jgi:hypothetical protein